MSSIEIPQPHELDLIVKIPVDFSEISGLEFQQAEKWNKRMCAVKDTSTTL